MKPVAPLLGVLLSLAVGLGLPGPMRAADAPAAVPLPPEPGAHELPGFALGGAVADIDGDGARDLVRLVSEPGAGGRLAVDGWRVTGDGGFAPLGSVRLRRGASVDEVIDGFRQIDRDRMLPLGIDEPARFVIWHEGTRERLLLMTIGTSGLPVACCLTVWAVGTGHDGLSLELLANTQDNATSVRAVDLDGDGTDELFVTKEPDARSPNQVPVRVLRWEAGRFHQLRGQFVAPPGWEAFAPVDSDARPGSEVLISADRVDNGPGALLYRIFLTAGAIRVESEPVSDRGQVAAVETPAGQRLVLVPPETGSTLELDWPPGALIQRVEATAVNGQVLGRIGEAAGARVLVAAERDVLAGVDAYGPGLNAELTTTMSAAALAFVGGALPPYVGPLPGGLPDGEPAFLFGGQLITSGGGDGGALDVAPMGSLPGIVPLGVLGPHGAWMALLPVAGYDAALGGGPLGPRTQVVAAPITLAPTALVLSAERGDGRLHAGFPHLVVGKDAGTLLSRLGTIAVEVAAPDGTRVRLDTARSRQGPPRSAMRVGSAPARLRLGATQDELAAGRLRVVVSAVTPAGHGYTDVRQIDLRLQPPRLEVSITNAPPSFEVRLSG
ncbi:MAG TPA: hypothetical protein VFM74_07270, partial [Candidatus Limnocylindria bacterium]|nr:hypothetical protein [Candidatus Limnocylindria bacterium]